MRRSSLHWLRTVLLGLNWTLLGVGTLVIFDYWKSSNANDLVRFFAYGAGPFYVFAGAIETWFAWNAAKGFDRGEPLRLPWLLLTLAGLCHLLSVLLGNVLNQTAYINPIYLLTGRLSPTLATEIRHVGLVYFGDLRFVFIGVAFWLVLRAERRVGLRWMLTASEIFLLVGAGIWLGIHTTTAFSWLSQERAPISFEKGLSWALDFLLGAVLMMAIFIRSSIKPLEPGMIARVWRYYVWGVFVTCAGNAGIWATNYSVIVRPYDDLVWLIWFPQVTLFALGPLWQYQAMRAAAGEWEPSADRKLASAARAD